jgi:anaerobic magnesium-protoporphyrin IX monomethyl ester cyclase
MRVLLINPPYQTLTSNLGVGHQVPLGLLMVGGPLIDAGHEVRLMDAERRRLSVRAVVREVRAFDADVVMTGHAGSTPAHPVCVRMLRAIRAECPSVLTVYGGVYPTYHAAQIIDAEPAADVVVRGEGEAAPAEVLRAMQAPGGRLDDVAGIAFRRDGRAVLTPDRPPLRDLDAPRTAWELIERWDDYRCFGMGRAAIVQFSRGCPHRCTYCGQHGFWVRWRHRDPVLLADEVEWLYRTHDVRFITLADENPTTLRPVWERLLNELAARRLPVHFFATIRATDIVRDADLLPLYRRAGILYVLMGIESTREDVLREVRKGSTPRHDLEACRLLKRNGIFSILGHIVGLGDESWPAFRAARRALAEYDGDYLNAMYVTPHDWTPFGRAALDRAVIEPDPQRWDYRHQVLAEARLRPWQLLLAVMWLEVCFHFRPRRVWSILRERDPFRRRQLLWCALHTGTVWLAELAEFALRAAGRAATWPCPRRRKRAEQWTAEPRARRLPLAVIEGTVAAS